MHVVSIHLASEPGVDTFEVEEVVAEPGYGLTGDRLFRRGKESGKPVRPKQQLTLIEAEALEAVERDYGIACSAAESRRNLCTLGVALNHLVGREFRVGEVVARGIEECTPCNGLEKMTGKPGLRAALVHRGGLRAEVVQGGTIRRGDAIDVA